MQVPLVSLLRQLLLSPSTFFDDRPPATTLPIAGIIVVVFSISLAGSAFVAGSIAADTVDATVTMDNPDRPPELICEQHGDDPDSTLAGSCDEPETIQRDAGTLVYQAATDLAGYLFVAPFVLWFLGAIVLYGVGWLADGTPSFVGTLALAGWAAVPEFFRLGVGLVALEYALRDVTITEFERAPTLVETALASIEPVLTVATVLTVGWQWYLLTGGLQREADISRAGAGVAVGVPLVLWLLLALL